MKKQLLKVILFFTALFGFVSCDVEPLDNGVEPIIPGTNNASFSVNFNNTNYLTNNAVANVENGELSISASNNQGFFTIQVQGALVGTYSGNDVLIYYMPPSESGETINPFDQYTSLHPETGQSNAALTITSIDFNNQTITGTFSFTGYKMTISGENITVEQMQFSQGMFVNLPIGGTLIDDDLPVNNGTMTLQIDGVTHTTTSIVATKIINLPFPALNNHYSISAVINDNGVDRLVQLQYYEISGVTSYDFLNESMPDEGIAILNYTPNIENAEVAYTSFSMNMEDGINGTLNITSNNPSTKIFSGNYNCMVFLSYGFEEESVQISGATFQDVQYLVIDYGSFFP